MESSERKALMLVRFVAAGIVAIGILEIGLSLIPSLNHEHPEPVKIFPLLLHSLPLLIGIVMFAKAKALAEWVEDLLE